MPRMFKDRAGDDPTLFDTPSSWGSRERSVTRPSLRHEKLCLAPVAGVDEAGRGPLAGPVVAAAVILPAKGIPRGIDDLKKLSAAERGRLHDRLRDCAIVGVGIVEADEIDRLNIFWATMKAMTRSRSKRSASSRACAG